MDSGINYNIDDFICSTGNFNNAANATGVYS